MVIGTLAVVRETTRRMPTTVILAAVAVLTVLAAGLVHSDRSPRAGAGSTVAPSGGELRSAERTRTPLDAIAPGEVRRVDPTSGGERSRWRLGGELVAALLLALAALVAPSTGRALGVDPVRRRRATTTAASGRAPPVLLQPI